MFFDSDIYTMRILFVLLIIATTALANLDWSSRVLGGRTAALGEIPYIVSYQAKPPQPADNSSLPHACGGAILSPTWIVTAGSCIKNPDPPLGDHRIVAGITSLNETGQAINIVRVVINPDYGYGIAPNDIALLQLQQPLIFNDNVKAIALPKSGCCDKTTNAVLSGWGAIGNIGGWEPNYPDVLQTVELPIIDIDLCKTYLDQYFGVSGEGNPFDLLSNICAGSLSGQNNACVGDTGGPLVQNNALIGIVTWLMPCGIFGAPSVYTNIAAFIKFIKDNVIDLPSSNL